MAKQPRTASTSRHRVFLGTAATLVFAGITAFGSVAWAASDETMDTLLSRPVVIVVALALVSLLPFVFMAVTSFLKISTVLHIVRGAIGAQSIPSSTVVMALAAALTMISMAPVGSRILDNAGPVLNGPASTDTVALASGVIKACAEPIREFLKANASEKERARFYMVARAARPAEQRSEVHPDDIIVLIPAFMVTELMEAFALGFMIFLPFLVIDVVIANVLLSLGMQMMSPTQVSLPFKLILFVAVDGWGLMTEALVSGYLTG